MKLLQKRGTVVSSAINNSNLEVFLSEIGSAAVGGKYSVYIKGYVTCS